MGGVICTARRRQGSLIMHFVSISFVASRQRPVDAPSYSRTAFRSVMTKKKCGAKRGGGKYFSSTEDPRRAPSARYLRRLRGPIAGIGGGRFGTEGNDPACPPAGRRFLGPRRRH